MSPCSPAPRSTDSLADDGLKPTLLIASPQLQDPFFEGALVLLWHHDQDGALGVVINRHVDHPLEDVLSLDDVDLAEYDNAVVSWGGPVETDTGTVITSHPLEGEDVHDIGGGLHVSRSQDALVTAARARGDILLCLGYAGWGPGQLDSEIEEGSWLFADIDPKLILTRGDDTYHRALASIGLTAHTVWMSPVDA